MIATIVIVSWTPMLTLIFNWLNLRVLHLKAVSAPVRLAVFLRLKLGRCCALRRDEKAEYNTLRGNKLRRL